MVRLISVLFAGAFLLSSTVMAGPSLPKNIKWLTNDKDPVFSSSDATKGGTHRMFLNSFPLTLRVIGPDSNGAFAGTMRALRIYWSLVDVHPNTENIVPSLATHWAFGKDGKTMYFKLDKDAKWSDGKPITAQDYAYTLEFMKSKDIMAPWYNTYYGEQIGKVTIFDKHTISVSAAKVKPDLHLSIALSPTPKHFYKGGLKGFPKKYNWKIAPVPGPYQIAKIKKGKKIVVERIKNWWGKDKRFYKNRFNVDRVTFKVIREMTVAYEHFKKGDLDSFGMVLPDYWHGKGKGKIFDRGYVHKLWFYEDSPQYAYGMYLNMDNAILKDKNVRYGFAHAMNIEKVIKKVLRNDYIRKQQYSTGFGDYSNNKIKARKFNLKTAGKYFDKAGWSKRGKDGIRTKGGKPMAVKVTYGSSAHTPRLVVLREEFKKAGLDLQLNLMDGAASFKSALEKKHDIWWGALGGGSRPQYWGSFHSVNAHKAQTNNFTATDSKKLDKLIVDYRDGTSTKARVKLSKKIQDVIHEIGAYVPTYVVPYNRMAYWRWVQFPTVAGTRTGGATTDPFNPASGGMFWIDKKMKKETKKAKKSGKKFPAVTKIDKTFKI